MENFDWEIKVFDTKSVQNNNRYLINEANLYLHPFSLIMFTKNHEYPHFNHNI